MYKKQKKLLFILILSSLFLGVFSGFVLKENYQIDNSLSFKTETSSLVEDLSNADLIIKGIVEEEIDTFKQDLGVETQFGPFLFDVTTFKVKVLKVLDGELDSDSITFYQHGSSKISTDAVNHVKSNEEVYLILSKRPDEKGYWSYNFDDGIWKITKDKLSRNPVVKSNTNSELLTPLNRLSISDFEKLIITARSDNYK